MDQAAIPATAKRLLTTLLSALLGRDDFAPGRPTGQKAVAGLGQSLSRWLEHNRWLVLLGGNPKEPTRSLVAGINEEAFDPTLAVSGGNLEELRLHLYGFWHDRHLVMICLRQGLTSAEFDLFYHLLSQYAGKGEQLRSRLFDEQARGNLSNVSLIFQGDLLNTGVSLSWPVKISLAWLKHDLNLLARSRNLPTADRVSWREQLLAATQQVPQMCGRLDEFFAHLDLIAETIDNYDKDELVFSLLEKLDESACGELCLKLCKELERLQPRDEDSVPPEVAMRRSALVWVTRRIAEHMLELNLVTPEHVHAMVLHKVLLYEEIPPTMRQQVANLQVLTSFLANPQKYFAEVENSHSPEVLEVRLWRILEMLPRLIEALRIDVARQVLEFSKRFGQTFDLHNNPEIMARMTHAVAKVLTDAPNEKRAMLMQTLPQMGRAGAHLLIELADHHNRSVRRTAFDALLKIGQPVVPTLFAMLEHKQGWHYLRNMLLLLAQLDAGGPKVEALFRRCLQHPEANVRKETLPGLAKLLRQDAASLVIDALNDKDPEVRKRAAACLGVTGIHDEKVFLRLSTILSSKDCGEDLAMQIVTSLNRIKPAPPRDASLETTLLDLLGVGRILGFGARKTISSKALQAATIQTLGYIGGNRAYKALGKWAEEEDSATKKAIQEALERLAVRLG